MSRKITTCKVCKTYIAKTEKECPRCGVKIKKPIFNKWWFIKTIALFKSIYFVNQLKK